MAVREIVTYGHPVLRNPAEKITGINEEILNIIQDMKDTLNDVGGLGLAAPQIGVGKQIFLVDLSVMNDKKYIGCKTVLINPEIIFSSKKTEIDNEGCLSLMDVRGNVERPFKIKIKGLTPAGVTRTITADGLYARALQHEFDHLHGRLFLDYFSEEDLAKNQELIEKYFEDNKKILPEVIK